MLIRIVRLHLQEEFTQSFHEIFEAIAPKIRQTHGCKRLDLWVDTTSVNIVTTYSEWDSESSLNRYRQSDLFKSNWEQVKPFFADSAIAHSYYVYQTN
ncbi:MAG: antibiotic biosynthesis monooxygenase [Bacteroidetes bacterium]|nr:antibiotic biosynthesis monooxygenase [Bacteroidota bacterium]MCY4205414.1 antibiotic biosynthesis monooxygenase [Bacteroidota bacterium]